MSAHVPSSLTAAQSYALFDILTHRETYKEVQQFRQPEAIDHYGPPFQDDQRSSDAPVLQSLLSKFALTLPGLSGVKPQFWQTYVKDLVQELSQAELSESYDKGSLGIRKTIATALSALLEYPARGIIAGVEQSPDGGLKKAYDPSNAKDVLDSWHDCLQEMVYGDLIDDMFEQAAKTDDLKDHHTGVQAMHEYIVINLASLIHYTLVLSPEGPSLVRMIENVHRLIPYTLIRQTLKVGNAATMISGVVRVMLAKVSVASMTNWMGLSAGADEGMNLLQQIISQVLGWDKRELKKRAEKIERDPKGPSKEVRDELKSWITRSREEHEECRRQSQQQGMSIVSVILSLSAVSPDLTDEQHAKALEYLSLNLAVRDRQEIVRVLCQRNPDHLTAAVRIGVEAYTPMIRSVHEAVDLSDTLWDFERFVTDMLKVSKPGAARDKGRPPSVEDYVDLLHSHQSSSHKFLHQIAKNGPEMVDWWRKYVHQAAAQFRSDDKVPDTAATLAPSGHGQRLRECLRQAFTELPETDRKEIISELDAYITYLDAVHAASAARIGEVIDRSVKTSYGPGAYLVRWQDLLDTTPITPATPHGSIRHGDSKSVREETLKDVDGTQAGFTADQIAKTTTDGGYPHPPSVNRTWTAFEHHFRQALSGA